MLVLEDSLAIYFCVKRRTMLSSFAVNICPAPAFVRRSASLRRRADMQLNFSHATLFFFFAFFPSISLAVCFLSSHIFFRPFFNTSKNNILLADWSSRQSSQLEMCKWVFVQCLLDENFLSKSPFDWRTCIWWTESGRKQPTVVWRTIFRRSRLEPIFFLVKIEGDFGFLKWEPLPGPWRNDSPNGKYRFRKRP